MSKPSVTPLLLGGFQREPDPPEPYDATKYPPKKPVGQIVVIVPGPGKGKTWDNP